MNAGEQFLWVIFPYIVITVFLAGHIYRFNGNPFSWTSKSSELLEKRVLRWGSLMFHWGIVFVFLGHVAGLLVPLSFYRALGVPDEVYHGMAVGAGGVAGFVTAAGALILLIRRWQVLRIRRTSSTGDWVALVLLVCAVFTGMAATLGNAAGHSGFDYRTTISPWIRGVLLFHPNASLMHTVPWLFKMHILTVLSLFAVWPFTRLVHVFSLPLGYLWRSYVVYRRRVPPQAWKAKSNRVSQFS